MLELFPEGFEEIAHADGVELVAYTDPRGEERLWQVFGSATGDDVAPDWEQRWRDFHRPVRVGELWIGPPWLEPPEDATPVVIDPGRAFGTGAHPTTVLCVQLLGGLERAGVLDIGCGSGVLSIAAAKLGFGPVIAIDSDEHAVEATRANSRANEVRIDVRHADALAVDLPPVEIMMANVTREFVEALAARGHSRTLVTSGYLVDEAPVLRGYRHVERISNAGWAADLHDRERE